MKNFIAALATFTLGAAALLAHGTAAAQPGGYPDRSIRLISPFPPGGGTDAVARIIAARLTEQLGQQVVIDNRAGAGGSVGTDLAAHAPADGYTLVLGSSATHAVNPSIYPHLGYDPIADFAPVSLVAQTSLVLMVRPTLPAKNIAELVALAKQRPAGAGLTFASAGPGSAQHLGGELFKSLSGANLLHVPYRGAGPAMTDLLAGQVDMMFDTKPSALPQVRAGKLRALGVSSAKRDPELPNVPAIAETVPRYELVTWYALFAPKGTPPAIVERLNAEVQRALASPQVRDQFKAAGIDPSGSSAAALGALLKTEVPKWRKVIQDSGAKLD
jgi:tripartite-type tricarboxylate transporter receptor subunit TctC